MLYVVIAFVALLALLLRTTRTGRNELLEQELRYDIFALRDELRMSVIEGTIPESKWFLYLDTTFSRTVDRADSVTVWDALASFTLYGARAELKEAIERRERAFMLPDNRELARLHREYQRTLRIHLHRRHTVLEFACGRALASLIDINDWKAKVVAVFSSSPPTSTLLLYAQDTGGLGHRTMRGQLQHA